MSLVPSEAALNYHSGSPKPPQAFLSDLVCIEAMKGMHISFCPFTVHSAYENNYVNQCPTVQNFLRMIYFKASKQYVSPSHQSFLIEIIGLSHL